MIEYPHIINASKAPRDYCFAFDKIDGSNLRFKYTQKKGFHVFGSRSQLIDASHSHLGQGVSIFIGEYADTLEQFFKSDKFYRNFREIIVFAELFGPRSFAGLHEPDDPKTLTFFDVLVGHKDRAFIKPKQFISDFSDGLGLPTPAVVYEGKLNDEFIEQVRQNLFRLNEGVVCKGMTNNGAYRGKMWMCKIKTLSYYRRLKERFAEKADEYWE